MNSEILFSRLDRILEAHLDRLVRRQSVLAANVANVETPGYRARDLGFEEELDTLVGNASELERTQSGHLGGVESDRQGRLVTSDRQPGVDGNNVNLDRELIKTTENAIRYQAVSTALSRRLQILRHAISEGR